MALRGCIPLVGAALHQQHRGFVAADEVRRLRALLRLMRGAEHVDEVGVLQRQEVVRASQADEACQLARMHADAGEPVSVGREQSADMGAGGMDHQ